MCQVARWTQTRDDVEIQRGTIDYKNNMVNGFTINTAHLRSPIKLRGLKNNLLVCDIRVRSIKTPKFLGRENRQFKYKDPSISTSSRVFIDRSMSAPTNKLLLRPSVFRHHLESLYLSCRWCAPINLESVDERWCRNRGGQELAINSAQRRKINYKDSRWCRNTEGNNWL